MSLFSQSREIHRQLRRSYRRELSIATATSGDVLHYDDKRVAMMFVMELHHRQVLDALQRNPLSAMLSIGWTLSSTSHSILPQMKTNDYMAVWSPFLCLVNALRQLDNQYAPSKSSSSSSSTPPSPPPLLFDLDDLRMIDRAFFDVLTGLSALSRDERRRQDLLRTNSDLFTEKLTNTPFGTYQIDEHQQQQQQQQQQTTITTIAAAKGTQQQQQQQEEHDADDVEWVFGGRTYRYVDNPLNVRDRQRYSVMFERHETAERLRRQTEMQLRAQFATYHRMYGLHVQPWMVAAHEKDEEHGGSYPVMWQIQKSSLVWMFYHSLAALVTVINHPQLLDDFVATVRSLEHFVECGLCHHHWKTVYLPRWKTLDRERTPVDVYLLQTHNDIQASTDPSLRLTDAALQALREDYLNFARCIVTAISVRSIPTRVPADFTVNGFWCTVFEREQARKDVCREPWELWTNRLRDSLSLQDCNPKDRAYVKRALLQLEWDRLTNQ